jgi:uncharacterized integral membrane protein (TIGR00698 family)
MAQYKRLWPTAEEFMGWLPGLIACIIFAIIARNIEAWVKVMAKTSGGFWMVLKQSGFASYVIILLLGGMIIRNTVGIPKVLQNGVNISRPIIKPGIILLGAHYMWGDVVRATGPATLMVIIFVFGTAVMVMTLGKRFGVPDSLAGIMGAGVGICGVSAIIAMSPVVRSRPRDLFYAIATILLFGTVMLFTLPFIGKALGMTQEMFGAWVATAILNTAQLTAAAALYDSWFGGNAALLSATIVNIVRVVFIPIIVLFGIWFYIVRPAQKAGTAGEKVDVFNVVKEKFPVFVLGFFAVVILNTFNVFGGKDVAKLLGSDLMKWFFAIGFAGIGLNIDIEQMKKAGGTAFLIGVVAALFKAGVSLMVILALGADFFAGMAAAGA